MSKRYQKDRLTVEVCADRVELGRRAGTDAASAIRAAIEKKGKTYKYHPVLAHRTPSQSVSSLSCSVLPQPTG